MTTIRQGGTPDRARTSGTWSRPVGAEHRRRFGSHIRLLHGRMLVWSLTGMPFLRRREVVLTMTNKLVALYVHRETQQWIVRDPEGNFWLVPSVDNCWDHR